MNETNPAPYERLPFRLQIAFFRQKLNMVSDDWTELWKDAHNHAFTVAGATKTELLADLRQAVDSAIANGTTLATFQNDFEAIVKKHGWDYNGTPAWRSRVIYQTNIYQSHNAGRYQQMMAVKESRPYWLYKHGHSANPRAEHLAWNNKVLPADHEWWKTHYPQNGWGCQCKVFALNERQMKKRGLTQSPDPKPVNADGESYEWANPHTGEIHKIPNGIDPGFDYAPRSQSALANHVKEVVSNKPPLDQRLPERKIPTAFSTVKGVNIDSLNQALKNMPSSMQPRIDQLGEAITKHELKTLFIKQGEMSRGKKAKDIESDVEGYLQTGHSFPLLYFTTRNVTKTNGFTFGTVDHVVIKVKSTANFKQIDAGLGLSMLEAMKQLFIREKKVHSNSALIKHEVSAQAAPLMTWFHEMGHQLHFKSGLDPAPEWLSHYLTNYSHANSKEWVAEHFVMWLFARDEMLQWNPEITEWFDILINKVTAGEY